VSLILLHVILPAGQWRLQPNAVEGKEGRCCHWGGNSPNNELICLLVPVTLYSMLGFEENIFWTTVTGSNKYSWLL